MSITFYMKENKMLFIQYSMIALTCLTLFVIALPVLLILSSFYLIAIIGFLLA